MTQIFFSSLGELADPNCFHEPLKLGDEDTGNLTRFLELMWLIRTVEEKISENVENGTVRCPCHLAIGQEAVAVGAAAELRTSDRIFGGHRSHAQYLAQGGDVRKLLAEILGRETGCSRGMGGSMHLTAPEKGFLGSVPIVAGTVPFAVGAALAAKKDGRGDIGVCYLGDGAMEEGVVHESMNFAAVYRLPVLFVCENNLFSSHLHISLRQPDDSVARFADAHRIPKRVVDGNDVLAMRQATRALLEPMRSGGGPGFIEAVTYRWKGHVGHRDDMDVGVSRGADLPAWKKRDPILRLKTALLGEKRISGEWLEERETRIVEKVRALWESVLGDPFPSDRQLLEQVYQRGRESHANLLQ